MEMGGQHRQGMQHCASPHWSHPAGTGLLWCLQTALRTDSRTRDISTQERHWDTHRAQPAPPGIFPWLLHQKQQKQESPESCFPPPGILPLPVARGLVTVSHADWLASPI